MAASLGQATSQARDVHAPAPASGPRGGRDRRSRRRAVFASVSMAAHLSPQSCGDLGGQIRRRRRTRAAVGGEARRRRSRSPGPGRLDSSTTRSPSRTASRTSWVTNSTVSPTSFQMRSISSWRMPRVMASSAPNGSSISITSASWARARAIDGPLPHPAGELVGALVGELLEVDQLQQLVHPALCGAAWARRWNFMAASTLPATVSHGNSADSWNTSPTADPRCRWCPRWSSTDRTPG